MKSGLPVPKVITLEHVEDRFRIAAMAMQLDLPPFFEIINHVEKQIEEMNTEAQREGGSGVCQAVRARWGAMRDALLAADEFASAMNRYIETINTPCKDHGEHDH